MNTATNPGQSASAPVSVLYIENDLVDEMALAHAVADQQLPYRLSIARSLGEARATLGAQRFDIVLTDYELGDGNAFELMAEFAGRVVIFITGSGNEEVAAKALRLGVQDYLIKDPNRGYLKLLPVRIEAALRQARMQAAIVASEAMFRAIIDATPVPMALNNTAQRITFLNPAFARTFGYGLEDIPTLADWWPKAYPDPAYRRGVEEAWQAELANAARSGAEFAPMDLKIHCKDGTERLVIASAAPLANGYADIHLVLLQDVTGRKRSEADRAALEAQLRESQKMQAIGTLAGGIAHDFNNILAAILGNAELLRQDLTGIPEALESLEEITKASRRGRDLVQQILAFSRRQPVELKPMALPPLVEDSAKLLRSMLPASVSLQTQCGPNVPAVLGNATQIQQVIINLSTNAMQAMSGRPGRIDISLDTVVMDETLAKANPALRAMLEKHPGRAVRLTVKDAGPGMDADTLSRIFEPFFTTKAVNEGTGLGLSVVHGIVQSHQGVITVHSEVGAGTTFTIYLPLAAAETTAKLPDAPGAQFDAANELSLDGGKHVLYLDDDQFLVSLVKRLLERRGLRVSAYLVPGEALAALRANPASFDLVVSDYNMPEMSGLEVARQVHAIRADLPVVVASGFVDEALQTQAQAAGVREVIFKAEAMDGFCEVIARVLNEAGNKSKTS